MWGPQELRQVREEHRLKMEELREVEDQLFEKEQRLKAKRVELSKMERLEGSKKARAMERYHEEEEQRMDKERVVEKLKRKLHKMYRQKKEKEEMLEEYGEFTTYLYKVSSSSGTSNLNEPQDILHRFYRLKNTHEELTREIEALSQQLEERRRTGKQSIEVGGGTTHSTSLVCVSKQKKGERRQQQSQTLTNALSHSLSPFMHTIWGADGESWERGACFILLLLPLSATSDAVVVVKRATVPICHRKRNEG